MKIFSAVVGVGAVVIVLKLAKVIGWSWLWVLSPFWVSLLVYAILVVGGMLVVSGIIG